MKNKPASSKRRLWILLVGTLALVFCREVPAQVIVIVNPGISTAEVSKDDIRDVFTGASSSLKQGLRVMPVLLKDGAVHEEMLALYVGRTDLALRATWRSLLFSGQANIPKTLSSETAMVEYVAHTPGAIGYIAASTPHEGVKVLKVR